MNDLDLRAMGWHFESFDFCSRVASIPNLDESQVKCFGDFGLKNSREMFSLLISDYKICFYGFR